MATLVRENIERIFSRLGDARDESSRSTYDVAYPSVAAIRDQLTPRAIEFDEAPQLAERLIAIADAERRWNLQIAYSESEQIEEIWVGWETAADFLDSLVAVVEYLADAHRLHPQLRSR